MMGYEKIISTINFSGVTSIETIKTMNKFVVVGLTMTINLNIDLETPLFRFRV